jgi:hypothetical protein
VGDIDFKVISAAAENSNKFQKTRFRKAKSVESVVTLEGLPFNTSKDFLPCLAVQKIDTYIAKQCSHVEFPYFVMGSHLGANSTGHTSSYEVNKGISKMLILKRHSFHLQISLDMYQIPKTTMLRNKQWLVVTFIPYIIW